MKKINHLWEAFLGLVLSIPTIFIDSSIEIIKSDWPKTLAYRFLLSPLAIIGLRLFNFLLTLIVIIVLIDAIQGAFTEESFIPKIKEGISDLMS